MNSFPRPLCTILTEREDKSCKLCFQTLLRWGFYKKPRCIPIRSRRQEGGGDHPPAPFGCFPPCKHGPRYWDFPKTEFHLLASWASSGGSYKVAAGMAASWFQFPNSRIRLRMFSQIPTELRPPCWFSSLFFWESSLRIQPSSVCSGNFVSTFILLLNTYLFKRPAVVSI